MVPCSSHMHIALIQAIGCVKGVIAVLGRKPPAAVNDIKWVNISWFIVASGQ